MRLSYNRNGTDFSVGAPALTPVFLRSPCLVFGNNKTPSKLRHKTNTTYVLQSCSFQLSPPFFLLFSSRLSRSRTKSIDTKAPATRQPYALFFYPLVVSMHVYKTTILFAEEGVIITIASIKSSYSPFSFSPCVIGSFFLKNAASSKQTPKYPSRAAHLSWTRMAYSTGREPSSQNTHRQVRACAAREAHPPFPPLSASLAAGGSPRIRTECMRRPHGHEPMRW